MSTGLKSFDIDDDNSSKKNSTKDEINFLKLNLAPNYIYISIFDENYHMKNITQESSQKNNKSETSSQAHESIGIENPCSNQEGDSAISLTKLNNKEQIDEVKYFFFMVLYNECSYSEEYKEFKNPNKNELNLIRVVYQEIIFNEVTQKYEFSDKGYIFLPMNRKEFQIKSKNNRIYDFYVSKSKITVQRNNNDLLTDNEFVEKYGNNKFKIEDINNNNNNNNDNNNITILDEFSEEEMNKILFYDVIGNNEFMCFSILNRYSKEIDAIFTEHKGLNINVEEVNLKDGIEKLISGENNNIDNDLKSIIIFKNFKEKVIEKENAIVMEIKKSIRISDLIIQLKQDAKIFKYLNLNDCKTKLPKYFIGIICSYNNINGLNEQLGKLNYSYKGEKNTTNLDHILKIMTKMDIKVIIGVIKDEKINGYPLGECDFDIPGEFLRVDLNYLNEKVCGGKYSEEKIKEIILKYGEQYKSIKSEKVVKFSQFIQEMDKNKTILADKNKEIDDKNNEIEKKNKEIDNKNNEIEKKNKEIDNKNNEISELNRKIAELQNKLKEYQSNKEKP